MPQRFSVKLLEKHGAVFKITSDKNETQTKPIGVSFLSHVGEFLDERSNGCYDFSHQLTSYLLQGVR